MTRAGSSWNDEARVAVQAELDRSRSGVRVPRPRYDLADHGLTEDEVRAAF